MKLFFLLITINFFSCSNLRNSTKENHYQHIYQITKIDSINNWYIIYANKQDSIFKIVSGKARCKSPKNKLKIGNCYNFSMYSIWRAPIKIGELTIANYPDTRGFSLDKETVVFMEDSIHDLCSTKNLKGLCYVKNP